MLLLKQKKKFACSGTFEAAFLVIDIRQLPIRSTVVDMKVSQKKPRKTE